MMDQMPPLPLRVTVQVFDMDYGPHTGQFGIDLKL